MTQNRENSQKKHPLLSKTNLGELLSLLRQEGYSVIAPRVEGAALVYGEVEKLEDLPWGIEDDQSPAQYRLNRTDKDTAFHYNVGVNSWKKFLFPERKRVFSVDKNDKGKFEFKREKFVPKKLAFLGVRSCEISAMRIQDKVFSGQYPDQEYQIQRQHSLIIAVQCSKAGHTCFCTSMNSGPHAEDGFDLALTELEDGQTSYVVEVGTEAGQKLIQALQVNMASEQQVSKAQTVWEATAYSMEKTLKTEGLPELLSAQAEHPQWNEVSKRCLTCANCTMVCPTCFCTNFVEVTDLTGDHSERWRQWDSCFNSEYSYIHGGVVRNSIMARYRQWMTHKLSTWHEQFGTPGCVGCGRCITWCPVGIDITAEAAAIQRSTES